jgi:hypothetical protein
MLPLAPSTAFGDVTRLLGLGFIAELPHRNLAVGIFPRSMRRLDRRDHRSSLEAEHLPGRGTLPALLLSQNHATRRDLA